MFVLSNCNAKVYTKLKVGCIEITVICTNFTELKARSVQPLVEADKLAVIETHTEIAITLSLSMIQNYSSQIAYELGFKSHNIVDKGIQLIYY